MDLGRSGRLSLLLFQLKRDNCGTWDSWGRWELVEEVLHRVRGSPFLRGQSRSTSYKAGSNTSGRLLSWETCQAQVKAGGPGGGNADGLLQGDPAGKRRRREWQVGIPAHTEEGTDREGGCTGKEQRAWRGWGFPARGAWAAVGAPARQRGKAARAAASAKPAKTALIQKGFQRTRGKKKWPRYSVGWACVSVQPALFICPSHVHSPLGASIGAHHCTYAPRREKTGSLFKTLQISIYLCTYSVLSLQLVLNIQYTILMGSPVVSKGLPIVNFAIKLLGGSRTQGTRLP